MPERAIEDKREMIQLKTVDDLLDVIKACLMVCIWWMLVDG